MITAYMLRNKILEVVQLSTQDVLPASTIWLDAYKPDDEEREWLSSLFLEEVPEEEELDEIEASAFLLGHRWFAYFISVPATDRR